tara:strand:- start:12270 stop:12857 length:588 start_codon:yes stop_codon:yes gene_type:complete
MHGDPQRLRKVPIIGNLLAETAEGHLGHHKQVQMDMKLESNKLEKSLFFGYDTLLEIFFILLVVGMVNKHVLKMGNKSYICYIFAMTCMYSVLWNNMHVDMHGVKGTIDYKSGIPNSSGLLSRGPVYRYLWKYHAIHHLQKGDTKGNYNIILPGADFLFGTYTGFCYDNIEYCKTNDDKRCYNTRKKCVTDKDLI